MLTLEQEGADNQEYWYRYVDTWYAPPVDEFDRPVGGSTFKIRLHKFKVLRHTPKGVWLDQAGDFGRPRFVLNESNKRFACATIEEAQESFCARKTKQLRIYRTRARQAKLALQAMIRQMENKEAHIFDVDSLIDIVL